MPTTDEKIETDDGLRDFSAQFSTKISATPLPFGLSAPLAATYATLTADFASKLLAARDPSTRGNYTIALKDEARELLVENTRLLVAQVQGMSTVTDSQREFLGITVRQAPSPISAPGEAPITEIAEMNGWTAKFKVRPAGSEGRSSFATGATLLFVYSYVGATPPGNVNDWKFEGPSSKAIFPVNFDSGLAVGTKVWACCCWVTARGLASPACTPVALLIGGGVPEVAAA